jgi:hypothetical protein
MRFVGLIDYRLIFDVSSGAPPPAGQVPPMARQVHPTIKTIPSQKKKSPENQRIFLNNITKNQINVALLG